MPKLEWSDDRKLRFIAQNVVDALAPANAPLINPEVLKEAIDTGGRNFVRGARLFVRDIREPPRLPANVDVSKFAVGRNLGLSPGAIVLRDERFELIHYKPATAEVREVPDPPRTADDQQVLHPGPRAGAQSRRAPGRAWPTGLRDLLAQPGRGAS